jgi:hypothetical protein
LIVSSPQVMLELLGCSLLAAFVICLSSSFPYLSLKLALPISVRCAFSAILIINRRRKSPSSLLAPALSFQLTSQQDLISYLPFIMIINWRLAGACGSGKRSSIVGRRRVVQQWVSDKTTPFQPKGLKFT